MVLYKSRQISEAVQLRRTRCYKEGFAPAADESAPKFFLRAFWRAASRMPDCVVYAVDPTSDLSLDKACEPIYIHKK